MKELRRNARLICLLMLVLFAGMVVYFCYSVYFYGGRWFANPYNSRISNQKQTVLAGTIYDAQGMALAYSDSDGLRHYNSDSGIRRATSHVIGDNGSKVAGGAETFFAQYLLGFNSSVFDRVFAALSGDRPRGDDVYRTISAELSDYIVDQFPDGRAGALTLWV